MTLRSDAVFALHAPEVMRLGWAVFPCKGKEPLTKHGLLDASKEPAVIAEWATRWPYANIGIRTGAVSDLFVLDVDGEEGEDSLRRLERERAPIPRTIEALTGGGGRHLYFRHRDGLRNTAKRLGPGLDSRGEGGYVIAPPSLHPETGAFYEWSVDGHPDEVQPADPPPWIAEELRAETPKPSELPDTWRRLVAEGVSEGARNVAVTRLAGHLLRRYVDPLVVLDLIRIWNEVRCVPPLDDEEVVRTVGSIARKEMARRAS